MMFNILTTSITEKKLQIVQNTPSTVYTNTSLTIFRIGRIKHWDIFLFTRAACIGVVNAKTWEGPCIKHKLA